MTEVASLTDNSTFSAVVKKLFNEVQGANSLNTKTEDKVVDGVDCHVFSDRFGSSNGNLAVAKDTGLPVHLSGGTEADLAFDQWNTAGVVAAPPAAEVLN